MRALRVLRIVRGLTAVLLLAAACDTSPTEPQTIHDVTGHWSGFVNIPTWPLATPLEMDLSDVDGTITGAGGGVDCRYFATCGYFYSYTVTGSHDGTQVTIRGVSPEGLSWVLSGGIARDGLSMGGYGEGLDAGFPRSSWQMKKKPQ